MKRVITKLPAGEIIEIKKLVDGTFEVVQNVSNEVKEASTCTKLLTSENIFYLIESESLSIKDEFMLYVPNTKAEAKVKAFIAEAICKGVKKFYRPIMDPSFTYNGMNISFVAGNKPAVGKSYNWWYEVTKRYKPERNSRLGTRLEYGAFLGVLIKKLVEEGKSIEWAWNAVCNDSRELGHYCNSDNSGLSFEPTGSRCVCGFYDLANTCKILAEDEETGGFWLVSGYYTCDSKNRPLARIYNYRNRYDGCNNCVGWIVLD